MQRNEKRGVGLCNADLITGGKGGLAKCTKRCKYMIEKGKCKDYMSNWLHSALWLCFAFFLPDKLQKANFFHSFLKAPFTLFW